jgi:hypothetical protein
VKRVCYSKHVPCDVPEDNELHANEDQNCLDPRLQYLQKWLRFLIGWRVLVLQMCADLSETPYPSSTPTENNRMSLSPVRSVAIKMLPRSEQNIGWTGLSP